jgi:Spy/CpxP family protein refolding chaperone
MKILSIFLLLLVFCGRLAFPQVDLVKMKKEEEERRKKAAPSKAVVTEDNMRELFAEKKEGILTFEKGESDSASAVTAADSAENPPPPDEVKQDPEMTREYWQDQLRTVREKIARLKAAKEDYQLQLNRMVSDFYITSDSLIQNRIRGEMDKMRSEIDLVTRETANAQKELSDLLERARRKGVPPGWLRD